jgi:CRISPR/Cas system CSM-associated protein Csm3 (group 7 of RAMP superfamily)
MANNISHKLTGKILLKAIITNTSPMLIASGKNDTSDFEVIKTKNGEPYIPAAGFAGMLLASFNNLDASLNISKEHFWGTKDTKSAEQAKNQIFQSHIIIDDLKLQGEYKSAVRDGVAIEHKTNVAKAHSKYDYELLEAGANFCLNMEITVRQDFDKNIFLQFLHFIIENGKQKNYQQGAFKTNGFGILEWKEVNVYVFDFKENNPTASEDWFSYLSTHLLEKDKIKLPEPHIFSEVEKSLKAVEKNALSIIGTFSIKNAFIIGSAKGGIESGLDKTHLKDSAGNAVFTAKSARGPIRHRALRILNTIGNPAADCIIDALFGFVNEDTKKAQKGRFKTFETEIKEANKTQIQPRIKIDRFTGGTIETALMQTQPLWHDKETFTLRFEIENCKPQEAGLILLVMKDLMTADLPFGGEKAIGRGLLNGISLEVSGKVEGEKDVNFSFDNSGLKDKTDKVSINLVNTWVSKLNNNHGKR